MGDFYRMKGKTVVLIDYNGISDVFKVMSYFREYDKDEFMFNTCQVIMLSTDGNSKVGEESVWFDNDAKTYIQDECAYFITDDEAKLLLI
jgi:hypothetical protein